MEVITLKRIAEVLGLSISTVSRALKNHPDISENTKKRVHELADTLDYEPNINAISLRSRKNNVIGLIVPSISGFFYDSFISAVEEECRLNGYTLMILQSGNDLQQEIQSLRICRQNRVTGLFVCLSTQTKEMDAFEKVKEADIPLVFFDKVPNQISFNKVCIDDENAAKLAATAIIEKGKKNILALFGDENLSITQTRYSAFEQILSFYKEVKCSTSYCTSTEEAKIQTLKYFSKKIKPDAIFCMSDEILIGVIKALNELNVKTPEHVALLTMSDGFFPKLFTPEITYIETSGYKLGKLAFNKMLSCINDTNDGTSFFTNSQIMAGGTL
jgi:LacI family transcriptional regulator